MRGFATELQSLDVLMHRPVTHHVLNMSGDVIEMLMAFARSHNWGDIGHIAIDQQFSASEQLEFYDAIMAAARSFKALRMNVKNLQSMLGNCMCSYAWFSVVLVELGQVL